MTYEMHNYAATPAPQAKMPPKKSNVDSSSEKYSLRQRQKRKYTPLHEEAPEADNTLEDSPDSQFNASSAKIKSTSNRKGRKSNACSIQNASKPKTKAAPLSKYRRKTANARERTRMREINAAFENLRHCVPHTIADEEVGTTNEKLTKITTLRLAMKYIRVLSEALDNPDLDADFLLDYKTKLDEDDLYPRLSEEFLRQEQTTQSTKSTPQKRTTKTASNKSNEKSRKSTSKHQNKQRKQPAPTIILPSSAGSSCSAKSLFSTSSLSSCSSDLVANSALLDLKSPPSPSDVTHFSYLIDSSTLVHKSMSDLSSMLLESDGESLNLSDNCLSPSNLQACPKRESLNYFADRNDNLELPSFENPLELSLRLLESTDSLDYSVEHQPSSCISSPLVTLDAFNPFGDLFHAEFPEHSSLDLFLT